MSINNFQLTKQYITIYKWKHLFSVYESLHVAHQFLFDHNGKEIKFENMQSITELYKRKKDVPKDKLTEALYKSAEFSI